MYLFVHARLAFALLILTALAGCASTVLHEAEVQARAGRFEDAYETLDAALKKDPGNAALRTAHSRSRDRVIVRAIAQADLALASGRIEEAQRLLDRVRVLDPDNVRLAGLTTSVELALSIEARLRQARRAVDEGRHDDAEKLVRAVLADSPGQPVARALLQTLAKRSQAAVAGMRELGPAFQRPVTLEFREAQLRQVFEALARSTQVNFVFDKDVKADAKITVFLRGVSVDEAMRVVLATQQLERKLLNDTTVLIYPATPAKQREHQELVTRTFYLANAEAKTTLPVVKAMAKSRDIQADERLNAIVVRDVPAVIDQIEQLLSTLDLREPEVMLAVEVLEVASDRLDELGISWPSQINYGLPNAIGQISLRDRGLFVGSVANPAAALSLAGQDGSTNLLANPTIRARSREKAKVHIGEKLPVFTTTSTANVGVSASVTYLDVGLKLEVEPTVQRDGEVVIRLSLEVSNLLREVPGPANSVAYQVGTRLTTTTLRLRDGETQVLAGLVSDEDRKRVEGIPGLSDLPVVGRLFGVHADKGTKTEIVMLITPRIIHGLRVPEPADATVVSGTEADPGAAPLKLRQQARAGIGPSRRVGPAGPARAQQPAAAAPETAGVVLAATPQSSVGRTVSVTVSNRSEVTASGQANYDAGMLQLVSGATEAAPGALPFQLGPGQEAVFVLRVLPEAAGQTLSVTLGSVSGSDASGAARDVAVEGEAAILIRAQALRQ